MFLPTSQQVYYVKQYIARVLIKQRYVSKELKEGTLIFLLSTVYLLHEPSLGEVASLASSVFLCGQTKVYWNY